MHIGPRVVYMYRVIQPFLIPQGLVHPTTLSACVAKPLRYLNMSHIVHDP